jgi:hypothetical protein
LPGSNKKSLHVNLEYATQQFSKSKIATLKVA